ncbi:putative amino acid transporter [Aspergillus uvarum CBS 121591]|uniref:Putative amino acid transporter n=1 Tax=Aspergillus uvarum CBS 121591 TaxID=1448315 RepID=A0A319D8F9_9EURO|nr:putative amino acid transporter [Aspergillus uvarum CBS 121591]PYH87303.1 putative amino acid transporter [Aspergillus uvarum CBS 121591]
MAEKKIRTPDEIESFDPAAANEALQEGSVLKHVSSTHDAVFGEVTEGGPHYRSVGWLGTVALMLKTQIGLGVLSIPAVFDTLGIVPGAIILCVVAGIATWTSYVVGVFKLNHREVYGMDDACGWADFDQDWIFVAGSGILGVNIGLNAVSSHGACTAIFVVVATIAGFLLASIRTLDKISWLAWLGLACILVAVLLVTISVGIQDRPSLAPQVGPRTSDFRVTNSPSFTDGVSAVSSLIFACSATPAYFQLAAEMRDPRFFTRALVVSQTCSTVLYLVLPSKYIFVRLLRGSRHLTSNSVVHWCIWLACTLGASIIAYLIASGIPFFKDLVSLIGALLGIFLAYQPTGCMWFYDNWHTRSRSWRWMLLATWSVLIVVVGCFMTVAGTYGSIVSIVDPLRADGGTKPWTCADNSNS